MWRGRLSKPKCRLSGFTATNLFCKLSSFSLARNTFVSVGGKLTAGSKSSRGHGFYERKFTAKTDSVFEAVSVRMSKRTPLSKRPGRSFRGRAVFTEVCAQKGIELVNYKRQSGIWNILFPVVLPIRNLPRSEKRARLKWVVAWDNLRFNSGQVFISFRVKKNLWKCLFS